MKTKLLLLPIMFLMLLNISCDLISPDTVNIMIISVARDNALDGDFWEPKTTFPGSKRDSPVLFTYNNLIYYGLGESEGTPHLDMWTYDPSTETWTELVVTGHESRYDDDCTTIFYNGNAHIRDGKYSSTVWEFSPTTRNFKVSDFDEYQILYGIAAYDDTYAVFGEESGVSFEYSILNLSTGGITAIKTIEDTNFQDSIILAMGGNFYIGGGRTPEDIGEEINDDTEMIASKTMEVYDPVAETFTSIPSFPDDSGWIGRGCVIDTTLFAMDEEGRMFSWSEGDTEWTEKANYSEGGYSLDYHNSEFIVLNGVAYFIKTWTGFLGSSGQMYAYNP